MIKGDPMTLNLEGVSLIIKQQKNKRFKKMKKGDIVKFKNVVDEGDERVIMRLLEDPDGGRVRVETVLILPDIAPVPSQNIYPTNDLEVIKKRVKNENVPKK